MSGDIDGVVATAEHRAILESSLDGVVVFRANGAILEFNAAAEAMFDRRREDVIGLNVADVIMPASLREGHGRSLVQYVQRQTNGVINQRIEMPASRADGTEFRVEISLVPIAGSRQLLSASIRDITDRVKLEEQLRQSQKLQAIGQLAGGVAHDFNNLLTIVMGYTEAILTDIRPGHPLFEAATQIHDAGERAALLTRQLLLFGRKAILEPRAVDLNAVIQSTGPMLRRLLGEDVTMATVLDPSLQRTHIDRGQIEQVIVNLCLNARDAMPRGGLITIETRSHAFDDHYCRSHPTHKPGAFLQLSITDTGTGMTPDVVQHLFEPFFTTKGPGKGTGLGLSTIYGILQQAGGFITVETTLGTGSVFRVFLPSIASVAPQPHVQQGLPSSPGRETVLLVEDEEQVLRYTAQLLGQLGYRVISAARAEEAFATLESGVHFDLLLTDVRLPGMDGHDFFRRVSAMRGPVPVVFMSGFTDNILAEQGLVDAGALFLPKPFSWHELALKVRTALDARRDTPSMRVLD